MYCGQTAGWIKMPLSTEVSLGPVDIVLHMGLQLPLRRGTAAPLTFRLMLIVAKRSIDQDDTWYGNRHRSRPHCIRWGPSSSPSRKGHSSPSGLFGSCLLVIIILLLSVRCLSCLSFCLSVCNVGVLWPNGWTDQVETWQAGRPRPRPHCVT